MATVSRETGIFPEYLGDISTEALLQNLTNVNPYFSSIGWVRESVPQGFSVSAEFEQRVYETEEERQELLTIMAKRAARYAETRNPDDLNNKAKLIRIVLEPKE